MTGGIGEPVNKFQMHTQISWYRRWWRIYAMSRCGNRAVSMGIASTLDKLVDDIVKRFQLPNMTESRRRFGERHEQSAYTVQCTHRQMKKMRIKIIIINNTFTFTFHAHRFVANETIFKCVNSSVRACSVCEKLWLMLSRITRNGSPKKKKIVDIQRYYSRRDTHHIDILWMLPFIMSIVMIAWHLSTQLWSLRMACAQRQLAVCVVHCTCATNSTNKRIAMLRAIQYNR